MKVIKDNCVAHDRICTGCPLLTFSQEEPYKDEEVCMLDIDPHYWDLKGEK